MYARQLPMSLTAFLVAFGLTVAFVPLARRAARVLRVVARPTDNRWHERPVPHLGGVAMLPAWLLALAVTHLVTALMPVVVAATLMFTIGLVDDLRPIRPTSKLILQIAAAGVFLFLMPPIRLTGLPLVDVLVELFWVVGITNAFNLLDNIDGLAAGIAAIAATCFVCVARLDGGPLGGFTAVMAALAGVGVGFLVYNFHPASIFMGDSGSHLIGGVAACTPLMALPHVHAPWPASLAVPIVVLLVPIFDTGFVTLTRRLAGRSPFIGGRDHTSHRLVALGIGERPAVLLLYGVAAAGGGVAMMLTRLSGSLAWGAVGIYVATVGLIGLYLGHIQSTRDGLRLSPPPLPSELANRWRASEVALDAILVTSAYYAAFLIRFRGPELDHFLPFFTASLPIVVATQLVAIWLSGKYRQVWRILGPPELLALCRGAIAGVAASVIVILYVDRFEGYSRSVFAFDALLAPGFIMFARVGLGALDESLRRRRAGGRLALIYGAGRGGVLALRELRQNAELGLKPLGFLDDDAAKRRLRIDGLPVVGALDDLVALLRRPDHGIATVIISIDGLPRDRSDALCEICEAHGIEVHRFRFAIERVEGSGSPGAVVRFRRP